MTQPLEPLTKALHQAKETIDRLGAELRRNEDQTRQSLINPILRELGWETANPAAVRNQFPIKQGRVDYALMAERDYPIAIIEAKRLGESIEDNQSQLVAYAYDAPVQFAALTDGNIWEIYRVEHDEGAFTFRRLSRATIGTDPLNEVAMKMLQLSHENLGSEQPFEIRVIPLVPEVTESGNGEPPVPPKPPQTEEGWTPLTELNADRNNWPIAIRFASQNPISINSYVAVFVETTAWLVREGKLKDSDLPLRRPGGSLLANLEPKKANGSMMDRPRRVENRDIYVDVFLDGQPLVQSAIYILKQLGEEPSNVSVRLKDAG